MSKEIRKITDLKKLNNDRYDYSRVSGELPLPNLINIQLESYNWFLKEGLTKVFNEVFPIKDEHNPNRFIAFKSLEVQMPQNDYLYCKRKELTYCGKVVAKLVFSFGGTEELKEKALYMCNLPLMTKSGTFIINGAERCVASQILRAPGAYFPFRKDITDPYMAELHPGKGTFLQFKINPKPAGELLSSKDIIWALIDKNKKFNVCTVLKAIGLTKDQIVELFAPVDNNDEPSIFKNTVERDNGIANTQEALEEIFKKIRPGEPISTEGNIEFLRSKYFDGRKCQLGEAGRFKFNLKLNIYSRLVNVRIAEDLDCFNADGVKIKKGDFLTKEDVQTLKDAEYFSNHNLKALPMIKHLDDDNENNLYINVVKVYSNKDPEKIVNVIGNCLDCTSNHITVSDIVASFSYLLNIQEEIGEYDDIDHLGNRRIKRVGELLYEQFWKGLCHLAKLSSNRMASSNDSTDKTKITDFINTANLNTSLKSWFASDQLVQFMDQVNPLAELTNKRRISALGKGGLTRERASIEVRDVHNSHYGRICPVETPEGQNIGLISNLCCYARINKYGFIETPYRPVLKEDGCKVLSAAKDSVYLSATDEWDYYIAQANIELDDEGRIKDDYVLARNKGETKSIQKELVDFVDVSPRQVVSIAAGSIPFLQHDDTMRALMGSNMQRQALPLLRPEAPIVGTGLEHTIAHDSGNAVICRADGVVTYTDAKTIKVLEDETGTEYTYNLIKFLRSNNDTCMNQTSIVKVGQKVKKDDIIADGPAMQNGDLALGRNVTVAFMTWHGFNYEDAIIMSSKLVKDDVYTTIHISKYDVLCRTVDALNDNEIITRDIIPAVSHPELIRHLDENGIVTIGSEVKPGDYLVGKITPKGRVEEDPLAKLLRAIMPNKNSAYKDTSLKVPTGGGGIVIDVKVYEKEAAPKGEEFPKGVTKIVRVYIAQKRKISEGDKMSGRHGNKGVISRILPECDMPFLPDGTPVDIMLNPLGVPSRMNIGQLLEVHLGYALKTLGYKISTPVFDGITNEEIIDMMKQAHMNPDGKSVLYDGQTGEMFDARITVGTMYMIKLVHMVTDKLHARATGPYSLVPKQPLGGKAQNGGQRFGEMEVWALEAYGAANILQELMTTKSDDVVGRVKTYRAITKGEAPTEPGMPEAFKVLVKELQSLALNIILTDVEGKIVDLDALAKENDFDTSISKFKEHTEELDADDSGDSGFVSGTNTDDDYNNQVDPSGFADEEEESSLSLDEEDTKIDNSDDDSDEE